jgi:signal transduction histidine kinase
VIKAFKSFVKRFWPALRLRTILLGVLLFSAAMPGIGAVFLRVYENTLVRQTEAELITQSAALAATAQNLWPTAYINVPARNDPTYYQGEFVAIDLSSDAVLPERPKPRGVSTDLIDPEALIVSDRLGPIIEQTARTTLASIVFVDRNGRFVWGPMAGADYSDLPEVRSMLSGRAETVLRRNAGYHPVYSFEWLSRAAALRIHHARPIVVNGKVVGGLLLSRSPRGLFKGIYQDRGKIILGVSVIFAVIIVLAGLISRGVTRPIEALSRASREVAAGQGDIPETPATAAIEIQALYEDFRTMAEAISLRSRYLKDFAAAVSHEFKTPLAGISGAIELLQDHAETMSETERKRFLGNISADAARLSQLVGRLMDLAKADMTMPEAGAAGDVADNVIRVADAMTGHDFTVTSDLPRDLPHVAVPSAAIETVLTTLVENARQAGAKTLNIKTRAKGRSVCLTVTDDGPGIPATDMARVFEPFFTSHRADGGSGLGLPIARSLLSASKGEIVAVKAAKGARFEVTLPVA